MSKLYYTSCASDQSKNVCYLACWSMNKKATLHKETVFSFSDSQLRLLSPYLPTYLPLLLLVYTIIKIEHHRVAFVFTLWVRVHVCQIELKAFFCGAVWLFQGACYFSLCVIVSMWWIPAIMSQRHCTYRKTHTHTSVLDWLHLCCITRATQMITIVSLD